MFVEFVSNRAPAEFAFVRRNVTGRRFREIVSTQKECRRSWSWRGKRRQSGQNFRYSVMENGFDQDMLLGRIGLEELGTVCCGQNGALTFANLPKEDT